MTDIPPPLPLPPPLSSLMSGHSDACANYPLSFVSLQYYEYYGYLLIIFFS